MSKLVKTGNSTAVVIPSKVLASRGMRAGDEVQIITDGDDIIIRRLEEDTSWEEDAKHILRKHARTLEALAHL